MRPQQKMELRQKGWPEQEIKKAEEILERQERYDRHFSTIVFWSALVVIIFANVVVSFILIPFLIVLTPWLLYALVVVLAGMVGYLYNFLITNIGHLQRKHHLWAGILVPVLAAANIVVMVWLSNRFIGELRVQNLPHNIWVVGGVFGVAFILPYVIGKIMGSREDSVPAIP